jgi:hypothetical protein
VCAECVRSHLYKAIEVTHSRRTLRGHGLSCIVLLGSALVAIRSMALAYSRGDAHFAFCIANVEFASRIGIGGIGIYIYHDCSLARSGRRQGGSLGGRGTAVAGTGCSGYWRFRCIGCRWT